MYFRTSFSIISIIVFGTLICGVRPTVNDKLINFIQQYMDETKDPCDDFYGYACSKWIEKHGSLRYSENTGLIDHKINKRIVSFIDRYEFGTDALVDKVVSFFKSCRRKGHNNYSNYLRIVKPEPKSTHNWKLLQQIAGTTEIGPHEEFNWLKMVAHLRRYGLNDVLLEHLVIRNLTDYKNYVIDLDKPNFESDNKLPDFHTIIEILHNLGQKYHVAFELASKLKSFEHTIETLVDTIDAEGFIETTIENLQQEQPHWTWHQYFNIIFGHEVPTDYIFQIRNFDYFVNLDEILQKTEPDLLLNYIMLRFLTYLIGDGSSSGDKINCMIDVRTKMDFAINFIYKEEFVMSKAKTYNENVQQIFREIQKEFHRKINENNLGVTEDQKQFLINKLETLEINMGNLPRNVSREIVLRHYKTIEFDPNNYYKNHLSLLNLRFNKEHEQLQRLDKFHSDEFFFVSDSATGRSSSPYYVDGQHVIVVPYGFLQMPIYHDNMHDVLKYSLLGFILAHEMAHAFDASAILFDQQRVINEIGITIMESKNYSDALLCMQRDSTDSLDERFADIVGIRLAYDALFNGSALIDGQKLGGMPVKEIFFLNFAQFFCGSLNAEFIDHDTDNVRLQTTLSHFEPFAETYKCRYGSTMRTEQTCRLW